MDEIEVFRAAKPDSDVVSDSFISIELNCNLTDELVEEGMAREVMHSVQEARKELDLNVTDRIHLVYEATPRLAQALEKHKDYVSRETLSLSMKSGSASQFRIELEDESVCFEIHRAIGLRDESLAF